MRPISTVLALLVVATAALAAAMSAAGHPALGADDRPATGDEIRQMRAAATLAVDVPLQGPLVRRVCFGTPRRCKNVDPPEVFTWKGTKYAEATFLRGAAPRQTLTEIDFERKLPSGPWLARAGGGYFRPLPCAVRRAFERSC